MEYVSDTAPGLIHLLGLQPHPEGGHYRETYRHQPADGGRGHMTAIHYLLQAGEISRWHRVTDADELWIFQTGSALELTLSADGVARDEHRLGLDIARGDRPQLLVPAGCWQTARSSGLFTLVACVVTPAFQFESFEMAPEGWQPSGWREPTSPSPFFRPGFGRRFPLKPMPRRRR